MSSTRDGRLAVSRFLPVGRYSRACPKPPKPPEAAGAAAEDNSDSSTGQMAAWEARGGGRASSTLTRSRRSKAERCSSKETQRSANAPE